jgi:hypothetical protein
MLTTTFEIQTVLRPTLSSDAPQLHDYIGIPYIANVHPPCHYQRTKYSLVPLNNHLPNSLKPSPS